MKSIINAAVFCTCMFFISKPAFSLGEVSETGTTGMSFLKITPSAHIASLGGQGTANVRGPSALWSNPALGSQLDVRSFQFTHIEWLEGIKQEFVAVSTPSSIGHFGLSIHLFDSGDIELRGPNPSSEPDGIYSIKNAALSVSYATTFMNNVAMGITFKKLYQKISMETADGYAVDLGITIQTPFNGVAVACASRNNGRMGILRNERTKLPSDVSFGVLYRGIMPGIEQSFVFVGDFMIPKYGDSGLRLGIEVETLNRFFMRLGYRSDSDIQDISYGIGVNYQVFTLDVSYTPMKEGFDNALRMTLGLSGF